MSGAAWLVAGVLAWAAMACVAWALLAAAARHEPAEVGSR